MRMLPLVLLTLAALPLSAAESVPKATPAPTTGSGVAANPQGNHQADPAGDPPIQQIPIPPPLIADFVAAAKASPDFRWWSEATATAVSAKIQPLAKAAELPVTVVRADFGYFPGVIAVGGDSYRLLGPTSRDTSTAHAFESSRSRLLWNLDARQQLRITQASTGLQWDVDPDTVAALMANDALGEILIDPPLKRHVDFTVQKEPVARTFERLAGLAKCDFSLRNDLADTITVSVSMHDQTIAACIDAVTPRGWSVEIESPMPIRLDIDRILEAHSHRDAINRLLPADQRVETVLDACRALVVDGMESMKQDPDKGMIRVRGPEAK